MKSSVAVWLGEDAVEVGTLVFEASGARRSVSFAYKDSWLASPQRFALSPDLPLASGYQYRAGKDGGQSAFFSCLADTEPDGWARTVIRRDHAKQRQRRAPGQPPAALLNEFDSLLWVSDFSRVGAIRLQSSDGIFQRPSVAVRDTPALLAMPQLLSASQAVEENRETARDLACLRGHGTSLGGLRPKCSVIDDDGTLAIGKFPSVSDTRSIVHGEVLALKLAAAAGINAAAARVVDSEGVPVALIRRFDQVNGKRKMYLSARSMLLADPADQYSYVDIAGAIRQVSAQASADLQELWRRMVFNILINNVDDHLNNHGFLHRSHGQWTLAPAFDLNLFPDKERALKTWISEDSGEAASLDEALAVAPQFGLGKSAASEILSSVKAVVTRWKNTARSIGMTSADINRFAPAFEHDEV